MIKVLQIGSKRVIDLPRDSSISEVLKHMQQNLLNRQSVFSDGKEIPRTSFDIKGTHNETISIASSSTSEAPTPKVKKTIKYLKTIGFNNISGGGKGDHLKFKNSKNETIILNPDNRDKQYLDLGSTKSLAKFLDMKMHDLFDIIN